VVNIPTKVIKATDNKAALLPPEARTSTENRYVVEMVVIAAFYNLYIPIKKGLQEGVWKLEPPLPKSSTT
jgi:hypothetical protein